jgi:hypothetical protein
MACTDAKGARTISADDVLETPVASFLQANPTPSLNDNVNPNRYPVEKLAIKLTSLLVVLDIDDSRLEFPGRNLAVEQNVQLAVRAALEFRKTKVS